MAGILWWKWGSRIPGWHGRSHLAPRSALLCLRKSQRGFFQRQPDFLAVSLKTFSLLLQEASSHREQGAKRLQGNTRKLRLPLEEAPLGQPWTAESLRRWISGRLPGAWQVSFTALWMDSAGKRERGSSTPVLLSGSSETPGGLNPPGDPPKAFALQTGRSQSWQHQAAFPIRPTPAFFLLTQPPIGGQNLPPVCPEAALSLSAPVRKVRPPLPSCISRSC